MALEQARFRQRPETTMETRRIEKVKRKDALVAVCWQLDKREEGRVLTLDKREGGRVVKPLVQMTPKSIVLRPTPSPTGSRSQSSDCTHFDIYMRGLDDRKARI